MAELRIDVGHALTMHKVRKRGTAGGWGRMPTCVCGWNRDRTTWSRTYHDEKSAIADYNDHLDASPNVAIRVAHGRFVGTEAHQSYHRAFRLLVGP